MSKSQNEDTTLDEMRKIIQDKKVECNREINSITKEKTN